MQHHEEKDRRDRHWFVAALTLALVGAIALAGATSSARADSSDAVVLDWNAHALAALGTGFPVDGALPAIAGSGQTPPVQALHLAMIQGAVYDAVNAITGGHDPYLDIGSAPSTASETAAAATAAHDVIVEILGQQPNSATYTPGVEAALITRLGILLTRSTSGADDGVVSQGVAAGEAAADAMIGERTGDGRYVTPPANDPVFVERNGPGQWRGTPPGAVDPFSWVARVKPFAIEDATKFVSTGPPALTSGQYTKEYDEVKSVGSVNNDSVLSAEQKAVRDFYQPNPIEMLNRSLRGYVAGAGLGVVEQARFFALAGLSGADTFITCWTDKSKWSFWRPTTAIKNGNDDTNPKTVGDGGWTQWAATVPPYPDQSSGYNCGTGALMYAAESFLGQGRTEFSVVRSPGGAVRQYDHFRDVLNDTIDARIYQGLHFRTADEAGAKIGRDVARAIAAHELR